jgi:hypothetical protein
LLKKILYVIIVNRRKQEENAWRTEKNILEILALLHI